MMQKDIRVSLKNHIHFNHTSILKGDMLFFTHIVNKYGIKSKLESFPYLQYLLTIQKTSYHNHKYITNFYHKNLTNILQNPLESETLVPNITRLKPSVSGFVKSIVNNNLLTRKNQNILNLYN
ncbi:hypothetical protein, partial [Sulfurovum sp.]|uniref:hypothetical protein n=1 Tax=Sulfurovum sp. TaxID=1969726 RepID=UPI0025F703B9